MDKYKVDETDKLGKPALEGCNTAVVVISVGIPFRYSTDRWDIVDKVSVQQVGKE